MENGFMIINGGELESLANDLFEVPTKEREEEIIKIMSDSLKNYINNKINYE